METDTKSLLSELKNGKRQHSGDHVEFEHEYRGACALKCRDCGDSTDFNGWKMVPFDFPPYRDQHASLSGSPASWFILANLKLLDFVSMACLKGSPCKESSLVILSYEEHETEAL